MDSRMNGWMNKRHGPPTLLLLSTGNKQTKIQESSQKAVLKKACLWGQSECLYKILILVLTLSFRIS